MTPLPSNTLPLISLPLEPSAFDPSAVDPLPLTLLPLTPLPVTPPRGAATGLPQGGWVSGLPLCGGKGGGAGVLGGHRLCGGGQNQLREGLTMRC